MKSVDPFEISGHEIKGKTCPRLMHLYGLQVWHCGYCGFGQHFLHPLKVYYLMKSMPNIPRIKWPNVHNIPFDECMFPWRLTLMKSFKQLPTLNTFKPNRDCVQLEAFFRETLRLAFILVFNFLIWGQFWAVWWKVAHHISKWYGKL